MVEMAVCRRAIRKLYFLVRIEFCFYKIYNEWPSEKPNEQVGIDRTWRIFHCIGYLFTLKIRSC